MRPTSPLLPRPVLALLAPAAVVGAAACGGGDGEPTGPDPTPTASVRVEVTASGRYPDPDGFTVTLGSATRPVPAEGGTVLFDGVEPGSHTVELGGVDAPCAVPGGTTATVTAPAGAVGEATFAVRCEAFQEVACPGLVLERTSALPLEEIGVGELPGALELPVAASLAVDGTGHDGFAFLTPVDAAPGEALRLLVPIHPTAPLEGGTVTLTVSDGTRACPPVEMEVEGLPPAPGEMLAVVDALQLLLASQAEALGSTPEELVSAPVGELPLGLRPLAVAQRLLDGPGFDGSLRAVARGSKGSDVTTLLDRVLARTEVRATLDDAAPAAAAGAGSARIRAVDVSATQCHPTVVSGSEPEVLEACMRAAAEANRRASGAAAEVAEDIQKAFGTAGELQLPAADAAGLVFGSVFTVIQTMRERAAALYPSAFTSLEIVVSPESFEEDQDTEGRVVSAAVTATNRGYDLWQEILTALDQGVAIAEGTVGFDFSTGTDLDEVAAELRPEVEDAIKDTKIPALEIPAESFGPVDLADPEWVEVTVPAGDAVKVREGTLVYDPFLHGEATLSVRNRTEGGLFGGEQISVQVEVVVRELQLTLTPDERVVPPRDPGSTTVITLALDVARSRHPDSVRLDLAAHPEQGEAEIRITAGGSRHFVDYVPPVDPDFGRPDLIVAEHTARGGARAHGPPRRATATIRFARLVIQPRNACLEGGETLQLSAGVEGLDDDRATWSADVGSIDPTSGLYTAPESPAPGATATVRAESVPYPLLDDEVTVRLGGCGCQWRVTVDGRTAESQPGDSAEFQVGDLGGGPGVIAVQLFDGGGRFFQVVAGEKDQGPTVLVHGTTGTFPAAAGGDIAAGPAVGYGGGDPDDGVPINLTLTRNQPAAVEGSVSGVVEMAEPGVDDPRKAGLGVSFSVTAQRRDALIAGLWRCTVGG